MTFFPKDKTKKLIPNNIPISAAEEHLIKVMEQRMGKVNERFPLWTALGATFGLVAILYGFEKLIDRVDFFVTNPWTLVVIGVFILIATGTVHRKL